MIYLYLNEHTVEDFRYIQELKKMGVPDNIIQAAYDRTMKMREDAKNDQLSDD